jgi:isoleucyl-tRNA synthetase
MRANRSRMLCFVFFVSLFFTSAVGQAQAPAPGVSEGQKIGTIIKTAISTAAPGISSILDLIWGHLGDPTKTSAKKTDLQTAANNPQAQDAAKKQTQAAAQQAIQPISKVSDELAVINRFLGPSVTATGYLIVMRTKLADSNQDWTAIGNQWELAKTQINNLKSVSDSDLNKVRDAYLRLKLTAIRNANDTTVVAIGQEVSQKNADNLKTDSATLLATLADMTAVAGYELAELQADIGDLATWAKGGAGGATTPDRAMFEKFLGDNVH